MIPHARTALAALLVVLVAALTACDGGRQPVHSAAAENGRDSVVSTALLTSADLGFDFSQTDDGDLDLPGGAGIGCLTDELTTTEPLESDEASFDYGDGGFPAVFNTVETYRDADEAQRVMDDRRRGIAECYRQTKSYAGVDLELHIEDHDLEVPAGIEDLIAVDARASVRTGGVSMDIDLSLAVASVGPRVTIVGVVDLNGDSSALLSRYTLLSSQRLVETSQQ